MDIVVCRVHCAPDTGQRVKVNAPGVPMMGIIQSHVKYITVAEKKSLCTAVYVVLFRASAWVKWVISEI